MAKKKAAKKSAKKVVGKVTDGTIAEHYEGLKKFVGEMEEDVRKLTDEGVKAAARRVRSNAQEIKKICMQLRKDVIVYVKSLKNKKSE